MPSRKLTPLEEAEGHARLEAFRNQRLSGDYCFRFQLIHKPRFGRNVYYSGTMWGSWNERGPISRVLLNPVSMRSGASGLASPLELIVQNGRSPAVWLRRGPEGTFERLEAEAMFQPVFPGVLFRPFDLQMPFVYWDQYDYAGPDRIQNAGSVQLFLMHAPAGSAADLNGVKAVRIALDDTYDALRRVELIDAEGGATSELETETFKKVQGQWIVKEVSLKDCQAKDRTTFLVKSASVGLSLDASVFDPDLNQPLPVIPESMFKDL